MRPAEISSGPPRSANSTPRPSRGVATVVLKLFQLRPAPGGCFLARRTIQRLMVSRQYDPANWRAHRHRRRRNRSRQPIWLRVSLLQRLPVTWRSGPSAAGCTPNWNRIRDADHRRRGTPRRLESAVPEKPLDDRARVRATDYAASPAPEQTSCRPIPARLAPRRPCGFLSLRAARAGSTTWKSEQQRQQQMLTPTEGPDASARWHARRSGLDFPCRGRFSPSRLVASSRLDNQADRPRFQARGSSAFRHDGRNRNKTWRV